jgi:lipopolysaccharide export system permease protein
LIRFLFHPLDRYIFAEFVRVFLVTALGFPVLVEVLDFAENVDRYVDRQLPYSDIALSYLYWLPESMFLVLPAAVLFATVFTIGSLTRHSEITAAKASGISFHRMIAPILFGALLATFLGLAVGELVPQGNQKRGQLLKEQRYARHNNRSNFAFRAEDGRIYQIASLRVDPPQMLMMQVERTSASPDEPNYTMHAKSGVFDTTYGAWKLKDGVIQLMLTPSARAPSHLIPCLTRGSGSVLPNL